MRLSSGQGQHSDQGPNAVFTNVLMSGSTQTCAENTQKRRRRGTEGQPPEGRMRQRSPGARAAGLLRERGRPDNAVSPPATGRLVPPGSD